MTPVTIAQLRAAPTIDLMTAARALGLGRTKAYDFARRQQFPCRVLRIGDTYRVPTAGSGGRGHPVDHTALITDCHADCRSSS